MINSLSYHPPVVRWPKNAEQFIHYIAFVFLVLSSNATHKYVTNYLLLWPLLRTTRPRTCAVFLKASSDSVNLTSCDSTEGFRIYRLYQFFLLCFVNMDFTRPQTPKLIRYLPYFNFRPIRLCGKKK